MDQELQWWQIKGKAFISYPRSEIIEPAKMFVWI